MNNFLFFGYLMMIQKRFKLDSKQLNSRMNGLSDIFVWGADYRGDTAPENAQTETPLDKVWLTAWERSSAVAHSHFSRISTRDS